MDSHDPSPATSASSSSSNDEEKALAAADQEKSINLASKCAQFLSTYRHQNFPLPDSVMYYIAMNPSTPEAYQSLVKTCKYFFVKNPIIIFSRGVWDGEELKIYFYECIKINDLDKFISKLWIICAFDVVSKNTENIISSILPKFYRFDARKFSIQNQVIFYNEYVYLSAEEIYFLNVTVIDNNGTIVALEKLVENAVKAKKFSFRSDTALTNITYKIAMNLFENPNFSRIKHFHLKFIPEAFDIGVFYEYMKKNKTAKFDFHFSDTISDAYKTRLDAIIDEILGTDNLDYVPPLLYFHGINLEKYRNLLTVHCRYFLRIDNE